MNTNPILSLDEETQVQALLNELKKFVTCVPVSHYTPPTQTSSGSFSFDHKASDKDSFFYEDYSLLLIEGGHTGKELIKLVKLYCNRIPKDLNVDLWRLFIEPIPTEFKNQYRDFIDSHLKLPEDVAKTLSLFLTAKSFKGAFKYDVFMPYLYKRFRNDAISDKYNYLVQQEKKYQHFYQTIRVFRNKSLHLEGKEQKERRQSGDDHELFSPPTSYAPNPQQLQYCRERHLSIVLFVLFLFSRFYNELALLLNVKGYNDTGTSFKSPEELNADSKQQININYINRVHKEAQQAMQQLFKSTSLHKSSVLLEELPELKLQLPDSENRLEGVDGAEILSEELSLRRKLVVGPAGSGKTVMMLRMLQRDQPRLTPFYYSLENGEFPRPLAFLNWIDSKVLGAELLTMDTNLRYKVIERLHRQLDEGSAVFFIDSLDSSPKSKQNILDFIEMYPDCQYILGSQPDMLIGELKKDLEQVGFVTYRTKLFSDMDACKAARILSLHLSGADHSETLMEKVNVASQGAEIGRLPITFMQLVYLFEQGKQSNLHRINRSRLNWELTQSIKNNKQLEADEVEYLLEQPTLKVFNYRIQLVEDLCLNVYNEFTKNPQDDWRNSILQFPLVASDSDEDLRQFFELLQVVSLKKNNIERQAVLLRTLVTVVLLEKGFGQPQENMLQINVSGDGMLSLSEGNLPAPNYMLRTLADAVSLLPDTPPTEHDRLPISSDNAPIWFRLQPNYIVRQYLSTLMTIYQLADVNMKEHHAQLRLLFESIARMGHAELTSRLFEPFWIRIWLFHREEVLPGTTLTGFSHEKNPLLRILIEKTVNHDEFIFQMMLQKTWIERWMLSKTNQIWEIFFKDSLSYYMNDDQCERLFRRLNSQSIDMKDLGYYTNYIIASMDSLSLASHYDIMIDRLPGLEVQNHLMSKKGNPLALQLLTSILHQVMRVDPTNYKRRNIIVCHLIKYGAQTMEGVSNGFWKLIEWMVSQKELSEPLMEILDKISIEDIRPDIASKVYDSRIYEFQRRIQKEELRQTTRWLPQLSTYAQPNMFRTVSLEHAKRTRIQYTYYCQPDNVTFEVATECIDEMPEQKFCRLTDSKGVEFDHWFHVDDVVILGKERPITHIAELTVNLPNGAPRQPHGKVSFAAFSEETSLKYIHLFQKIGRNVIVIRIQDPYWTEKLSDKETVRKLKACPLLSWGGYTATLVGINIIPLPENMRIIRMRSVGDSSIKGINTVALSDIPHQGLMSFYHLKEKGTSPEGLPLKSPSHENQAKTKTLNEVLYLCRIGGIHYMAVKKSINIGNYLIWKNCPQSARIIATCPTNTEAFKESKLPEKVLEVYQKSIGHLFAVFKKAQKEKKEKLPPFPNYQQIVAFHFENYILDKTKPLFEQGVIDDTMRVTFYHPVCDPYPTAWQDREYPVELTSVTAYQKQNGNDCLLMVPHVDYPSNAAYYYDPYDCKRLPITWVDYKPDNAEGIVRRCLKLDDRLRAVWNERRMISFYESEESEKPLPITFSSLTEVVHTNEAKRYHASLTPLLIQEWMKQREVDDSRINFCQKKLYMHLLIEECYDRGIKLPEGLQVEIAYVLSVEDEYNATLFSLKKIGSALSHGYVPYDNLTKCVMKYYGDLPVQLKEGMLVMCTKSQLSIVNDRFMQNVRQDAKWGFVHGKVDSLMGNQKVSIIVEQTPVNFVGNRLAGNVWMEPGQHVIMFPIINPSNKWCAEAKYILAVD